MKKKINPFKPQSPVNPGMFAGRIPEIERIEGFLYQTKSNSPSNFIITGERGIGKTSLLFYIQYLAQGSILIDDDKFNYLVIFIDITSTTTQLGLIKKIESAIKQKLAKNEPTKQLLNSI